MISFLHSKTQPPVNNSQSQPDHLRRKGKFLAFISVLAAASITRTVQVNYTLPQSLRGSSKSNRLNVITLDASKNASHIAHTKNLARLLQATPELSTDVINQTRDSLPLLAQTGFDTALGAITTLKMLTAYSSEVELGDVIARPVIAMLSEAEFLSTLKNLANVLSESILAQVLPDLLKNPDFQVAVNEFIDSILTDDLINTISASTSEALEKVLTNFVNNPKIQEAINTLITNTSENPALLGAVNNVVSNAIETGSGAVFDAWASPKFFGLLSASTAVVIATALAVLHCYQKACGGRNSLWSQVTTDVANSSVRTLSSEENQTAAESFASAVINSAVGAATNPENVTLIRQAAGAAIDGAVGAAINPQNVTLIRQAASAAIDGAVGAAFSEENTALMQNLATTTINSAINAVNEYVTANPATLNSITETLHSIARSHGSVMADQGGAVLGHTLVERSVDVAKGVGMSVAKGVGMSVAMGVTPFPVNVLMAVLWTIWSQLPRTGNPTVEQNAPGAQEDMPAIPDLEAPAGDEIFRDAERALHQLQEVNEAVRASQRDLENRTREI